MYRVNHMYRTLLAAVALAFSSVTASAETVTVCLDGSCDYTSLETAIRNALPGSVIRLEPGEYLESGAQLNPVLAEELQVVSAAGPEKTRVKIQGVLEDRSFLRFEPGSSISFVGISFEPAGESTQSGVFMASDASLAFSDGWFSGIRRKVAGLTC